MLTHDSKSVWFGGICCGIQPVKLLHEEDIDVNLWDNLPLGCGPYEDPLCWFPGLDSIPNWRFLFSRKIEIYDNALNRYTGPNDSNASIYSRYLRYDNDECFDYALHSTSTKTLFAINRYGLKVWLPEWEIARANSKTVEEELKIREKMFQLLDTEILENPQACYFDLRTLKLCYPPESGSGKEQNLVSFEKDLIEAASGDINWAQKFDLNQRHLISFNYPCNRCHEMLFTDTAAEKEENKQPGCYMNYDEYLIFLMKHEIECSGGDPYAALYALHELGEEWFFNFVEEMLYKGETNEQIMLTFHNLDITIRYVTPQGFMRHVSRVGLQMTEE
jgi:hypothetical protein